MIRFNLPKDITLESIETLLLDLDSMGLLYHIDDNPFEVYNASGRTFSDAECYALIGFWALVREHLNQNDVWSVFPNN